ncbi:MAG: sensor histidine kinase [Flavisolibacter sp.]
MSTTLLQKNTRSLLLWLPLVMVGCSLMFFFILRGHAHHMQEKQLELKQTNLWKAFTSQSENFPHQVTGEYALSEQTSVSGIVEPRDTQIYFADKKQTLPFQVLSIPHYWQGRTYLLSTYVSSREITHLIIKVFVTEAIILVLLLLTIVVVNKRSARALWSPFFKTIDKLRGYDITRHQPVDLPSATGTLEFDQLNEAIHSLFTNVNRAYHQQKQFVENASHEMQTPLSIIRSKLELLINQPGLDEKKAALIGDITEANERLSGMNRTLLLLAKIENYQFPEVETVDASKLLCRLLEQYKEHYEENFPTLISQIEPDVLLKANCSLIEILFSNLIKNSVEHNLSGGSLTVQLSKTSLAVANTGAAPEVPTHELFDRFKKGSYHSKTTGLGLALVRQICLLYHYPVSYQFQEGLHRLEIHFP